MHASTHHSFLFVQMAAQSNTSANASTNATAFYGTKSNRLCDVCSQNKSDDIHCVFPFYHCTYCNEIDCCAVCVGAVPYQCKSYLQLIHSPSELAAVVKACSARAADHVTTSNKKSSDSHSGSEDESNAPTAPPLASNVLPTTRRRPLPSSSSSSSNSTTNADYFTGIVMK